MMPIPAVTFVQRTIHKSQNCGVRNAVFTSTLCVVMRACCLTGGAQFSGFHPSREHSHREHAEHHQQEINVPITRNVLPTPTSDDV